MSLTSPGPQLVALSFSQLTLFPNHSHKDPGCLERLSLAAEISSGEAIRFGGPGVFGGMGYGVISGHCGEEIEFSYLWSSQPFVFSHGGVEHWVGGRQPRGSRQHRPSDGECWDTVRGLPRKVCMGVHCQASYPSPLWHAFHRLIHGFILRHAPRCPENAFFLDHVRTSFLLNLRRQLPQNVLDTSWPTPPPALREVCGSSLLS
jgi:hypothetical protein